MAATNSIPPKHVVHVSHNLKGGGSIELGPKTLIVGPNGSGKSAIVNAVELALTGKASDIAGRALVAKAGDLASLANGDGAWAEATLNGGEIARWEVLRNGAALSRPKRTGPKGVIPLREVLTHLTGSADKARKFLLQQACGGLDNESILPHFDQDTLGRYQRLTDAHLTPIDNLLAIVELAGKKSRDSAKLGEGARTAEDELGVGLGRAPTEAEIFEASERHHTASRVLADAQGALAKFRSAAVPAVFSVPEIEGQLGQLSLAIQVCRDERTEKMTEMGALPGDPNAGNRVLFGKVMDLMERVWTDDNCLACGGHFDRQVWSEHADRVRAAIALGVANNQYRDIRCRELRTRITELDQMISRGEAKSLTHTDYLEEAQAQRRAPRPAGDEVTLAAVVEKAASVHETALQDYLNMRESNVSWEGVIRAKSARRECEREAVGWKDLEGVCKAVIEDLVDAALGVFSNRVQRYLGSSDLFAVQLDKSSVRYGLIRDGLLHTALSGAEWSRVSAALAAACTPDGAKVPVLVPEDRSWDPRTLRTALQGLSEYRGQVIVATTVKPYRGVPKGWTLVDLGNLEDSA